MAIKKTAKKQQVKDRWGWMYKGDDEMYATYPSYEAALKSALSEMKDTSYCRNTSRNNKIVIQFFQLAKESEFEFEVKETPVMERKVVFKGEVK